MSKQPAPKAPCGQCGGKGTETVWVPGYQTLKGWVPGKNTSRVCTGCGGRG